MSADAGRAAEAENDLRQDYLRATISGLDEGLPIATAFTRQDSSMLGILAKAQGAAAAPEVARQHLRHLRHYLELLFAGPVK